MPRGRSGPRNRGFGGFGFCFLKGQATACVKHPEGRAFLFEPGWMKAMVNNPGQVQAIQGILDMIAAETCPPDRINAVPGTTIFQGFLAGTGSMISWWATWAR